MSIRTKERASWSKMFTDRHYHATLDTDTDKFAIISWQSDSYPVYFNYIVDKLHGKFIVSSCYGESVAEYTCTVTINGLKADRPRQLTLSELRTLVNDENDYVNRFERTTNKFEYDIDVIIETLKPLCDDDEIYAYLEEDDLYDLDDPDDFWDTIGADLEETIANNTPDGEELSDDAMDELCSNEMLTSCGCTHDDIKGAICDGKRISDIVFAWSVGFDMACEQLGIKPAHQ